MTFDKAGRRPLGSIKQLVASLQPGDAVLFSGFGRRHAYYDAAKRMMRKVAVRRVGPRESTQYQVTMIG